MYYFFARPSRNIFGFQTLLEYSLVLALWVIQPMWLSPRRRRRHTDGVQGIRGNTKPAPAISGFLCVDAAAAVATIIIASTLAVEVDMLMMVVLVLAAAAAG